jgi:hypothetical protein
VTVAQLAYPAHGSVWRSNRPVFRAPSPAAFRPWSCNAALWRAILTGLGFAVMGLVMMVLAIHGAGTAPSVAEPHAAPIAAGRAMSTLRLEIYQDPAETLISAMPVP